MDREHSKRKAPVSPGAEKIEATTRGKKSRKINHPEPSSSFDVPGHSAARASNQIHVNPGTRASELTQKLVSMWVAGSKNHHPLMAQEVQDSIALKDAQQKCAEAENMVALVQRKVETAKATISELEQSLRAETASKAEIIAKMNTTGELAATITEHINYITDTLERCQQHKNHLSNLYNNIILKQREDLSKLKNDENSLKKYITQLESKVASLEKCLEDSRRLDDSNLKQMQQTYDMELEKLRSEHKEAESKLSEICKEKDELINRLSRQNVYSHELENKIVEYEHNVKKLMEQVTEASANLAAIKEEKSCVEKELTDRNRDIKKFMEDLEAANKMSSEKSTKISSIEKINNELNEKFEIERNERENLAKNLNQANERNQELMQQIVELKNNQEESLKEMRQKIQIVEEESKKLLIEEKKRIEEIEEKHGELIKVHVEKYESSLAEIKILEARHTSEISTVLSEVNGQKQKLEEQLVSLKREKEGLQLELRQVEDLLVKHTTSEMQLKRKLDQCQNEIAELTAAGAAEKKRRDEGKEDQLSKIKELETELLNLQFNQNIASCDSETIADIAIEKIDRRTKGRSKKPPILSYKKSILKRPTSPSSKRRTRSTPPSPAPKSKSLPVKKTPNPMEKKITFDLDSSLDGSPINFDDLTTANKYMNSDKLFEEMISIVKSSSQQMQTDISAPTSQSQTQTGTKKFFKSRGSQSK